jgi:hypothetical protein
VLAQIPMLMLRSFLTRPMAAWPFGSAPRALNHGGTFIHRRPLPQLPAQIAADRLKLGNAQVIVRVTPASLRAFAIEYLNIRHSHDNRLTIPIAVLASHVKSRTGFVLQGSSLRALTGDPLCDVAYWLDSIPGLYRKGNLITYQNPDAPTHEERAYAKDDALFRQHIEVHRPSTRMNRRELLAAHRKKNDYWMLAGSTTFRPKKKSKKNQPKAKKAALYQDDE